MKSAALLQTKLFIPPLRPGLVARPRLMSRLNQACVPGCHAVLLTAPAGFGKTTLITQWLATLNCPVSWFALEQHDNQPARFFRYLVAAFRQIFPDLGREAMDLSDMPRPDIEELVNLLANAAARVPGEFVLVLDDYHQIREPIIHQTVRMLLEALPPQARLVVLSREDPPLPIARLRARAQVVELRPNELRFTVEEAASFLNRTMGLDLSVVEIQALEARTEGWIAGLQLAALSLQTAVDRAAFVHTFSGSQRYILDYLVEEVLECQPAEIQQFLLHTAVLDRLCVPLCAALLEIADADAAAVLERIERANLFLIPLDETRTWYRYHHLFTELLRVRLAALQRNLPPVLHRRASAWFEAHHDPKAALDHAMAAHDYSRAADLIEHAIVVRWRESDLDFFQAADQLPIDVLYSRPSLCLHAAWLHVMTGRVDRVPALVAAMERQLSPGHVPHTPDLDGLIAFAGVLRAYVDDFADRSVMPVPELAQAVAAVPAENIGMRNSIAVVLGGIHYLNGDFPAAEQCFREAIERDKQAEGVNAVPVAVSRWARMLIIQGKLHEAARLCEAHIEYVQRRGIRRFYIAGNLYIIQGEILREQNRLDAAEAAIREGLRLHEAWPVPQAQLMGLTALARLQIAQAGWSAAEESIERGMQLLARYRIHPESIAALQAAQVRCWVGQGRTADLKSWLHGEHQSLPLIFRYELRQIARARALLALAHTEAACDLLHRIAAALHRTDRTGHLIEVLSLLAAAMPAEQALPTLERAVRLAEPEGYLRTFAELDALHPLLLALQQQFARDGDVELASYTGAVLAACAPESLPGAFRPVLPEALTARELDVLRLVAEGLSNQQIADRLIISVRTVKKHIENVYGKLGAANRVHAVARARELRILYSDEQKA